MKKTLLFALFAAVSTGAMAQRPDGGSADRWNITGPAWYQTQCGHVGFSPTHGIPDQKWVRPCSVPIRVCEFKTLRLSFPADPDVSCNDMIKPLPDGGVQKTYLLRSD
jgi:hypothetical protein